MSQSLSCVLIHLVFSTKDREPWISVALQPELHAYLTGALASAGCTSIQVGGASDHVHLFFHLSRTKTIAATVEALKTSSSKWIKTKGAKFDRFHWQGGYGAFSISRSEADSVAAYIRDQAQHHAKVLFQDEYRQLLERYRVIYDEQYVWA